MNDLRYAVRTLIRVPGFALAAIVTLALGIAVNTALFSALDAVVLRPLPYASPERLVWMWGRMEGGPSRASVSPPDFEDYRERNDVFERLAAYTPMAWPATLVGAEHPEQVQRSGVSAGFFETFGARPLLGRTFTREEERAGGPRSVILGHALWRSRFGGDPAVVGRSVALDGQSSTVVGVMPAGFEVPSGVEIWEPLPFGKDEMTVRRAHFLRPVGLLKDGVTIDQAQERLDLLAADLAREHPDSNKGWGLLLLPYQRVIVGTARDGLAIAMGAVAFVLLIACVNVANLLLARAPERRREMAIRAALGADRSRLVRQLLTESLALAGAGGALGTVLAFWGVDILRSLGAGVLPRASEIALGPRSLLFTAALSLITGLLFGIAPALGSSANLHASLREGDRGVSRGGRTLRGVLVVSEIALTLVLLVGAGLLARSFVRLSGVDPGFTPDGRLTGRILLPREEYPTPEKMHAFHESLIDRVQAIPGVVSAGLVSELPLSGQNNDTYFTIDGRAPGGPGSTVTANCRIVSPGYFEAMGVPLLRGRPFDRRDVRGGAGAPGSAGAAGALGAVIVNEPFVRAYFDGVDPIGRRLKIELRGDLEAEVVGVVGGVRHWALAYDAPPEMYLSDAQAPIPAMNLVVKTTGEAAAVAADVRAAVWSVDPRLAVSALTPMEEVVSRSVAQPRLRAMLLGGFGVLSILLAAVGIHGVISWTVRRRTREIGVRMALGASRSSVLGMVAAQVGRLVAAGVVIGLLGALALTRLLSSFLYDIEPTDPATFAGVTLFLVAAAFAAAGIPARRAAAIDPAIALRDE